MNGQLLHPHIRMGDPLGMPTRYYWQDNGWKCRNSQLTGKYRTDYGNVRGTISFGPEIGFRFYVHNPPKELRIHPYWPDFKHVGGNRYSIHFAVAPKTINSGIVAVEKILNEALSILRPDSDSSFHRGRSL